MFSPFIITGATGSMGSVAVRNLVSEGRSVIMACRNTLKGEKLREEILKDYPEAELELIQLDLNSRESTGAFAEALGGRKISGIFNNAGVINRDYASGPDGIERTMAVNFCNPALLTLKLLPQFEEGAAVVNMVSLTTALVKLGPDWDRETPEKFSQLGTYARSKLALLLFSVALGQHCPQLYVNVADPGVVDSNMISMGRWFDSLADIFFRPFISSPEKGVRAALKAIHSDCRLKYFVGDKVKDIPSKYTDNPLCEQLWNRMNSQNPL